MHHHHHHSSATAASGTSGLTVTPSAGGRYRRHYDDEVGDGGEELSRQGAVLYGDGEEGDVALLPARAAVVAAAERRWDRDHHHHHHDVDTTVLGGPTSASLPSTSGVAAASAVPTLTSSAGLDGAAAVRRQRLGDLSRRYDQLQSDADSGAFIPAHLHWAALDLAASSHLAPQEEPLTTMWAPVGDAADEGVCTRLGRALRLLGRKLKGKGDRPPTHFSRRTILGRWRQHVGTFLLCFFTMLAVSALHYHVFLTEYRTEFFVAPFGATVAIVFSLTDSDAAQPRNIIAGHLICGVIGVSARHLFASHGNEAFMVAGPLALALSTMLLQVFSVSHPPALSTVLLAVYAPDAGVAWAGYFFLVLPILTGLVMIVVSAWLGNNVVPGRHYPCYW